MDLNWNLLLGYINTRKSTKKHKTQTNKNNNYIFSTDKDANS
jgi:hypothetical protein